MIGIIRVRFPATPASEVWSDSSFHCLMDITTEYSLAHYWHKTSFGQADLRYELFPPIELEDPRNKLPENADNAHKRAALVNGVTDKITTDFSPNWSAFSMLLIWFAQPTDLFGTSEGGYPVPVGFLNLGSKILPVAVCDIGSPFDAICHEFGHALGFEHPYSKYFSEYGDPYDVMSARSYGGFDSSFVRPEDNPLLPKGIPSGYSNNFEPLRVIGPLVSAAQLYNSRFAFIGFPTTLAFRYSGLFTEVPSSYANNTFSFTINALDLAVDSWSNQVLPIAAILQADRLGGDVYFLELRRSKGYDRGLRSQDYDFGLGENPIQMKHPPIGIVIHSMNPATQKLLYVDTFPLTKNRGDTDYHSFDGGFTFRVNSVTTDFRSVNITVGGNEFWRNFGISFDKIEHKVVNTVISDWRKVQISPCFLYPVGEYSVRYKFIQTEHIFTVSSFGYELPGYIWSIDSQQLDPEKKSVSISVSTEMPSLPTAEVIIEYEMQDNILQLKCNPEVGNFSVMLSVTVVETSPEVMKNYYENKKIATRLNFDNVEFLGGDEEFEKKQERCSAEIERIKELNDRSKEAPIDRIPKPDPSPFNLPKTEELIRVLIDRNPAIANIVIEQISEIANISKINILRRL